MMQIDLRAGKPLTLRCRILIVPLLIATCFPVVAGDPAPEHDELLRWVQTLRYQGREEQAIGVCEMILATDPTHSMALTWRGIIRLSRAEFDEAHEDFSQALRHGERLPLALVGRARALQAWGETMASQRDAVEASTICSRAIDGGSTDAMTWYIRGVARLLQEHTGAQQDFLTAIGLAPRLMDAYLEASHLYRARGALSGALERLTRAVEVRPDYAVGFLARARVNFELEDYAAAIAACDHALQINPDFARAWHNRGLVNVARGEIEEAISDLTEAIAAQPDYASAYFYRGECHAALGDTDAAREDLERARELDPRGWAGRSAAEMLRELPPPADPEQ